MPENLMKGFEALILEREGSNGEFVLTFRGDALCDESPQRLDLSINTGTTDELAAIAYTKAILERLTSAAKSLTPVDIGGAAHTALIEAKDAERYFGLLRTIAEHLGIHPARVDCDSVFETLPALIHDSLKLLKERKGRPRERYLATFCIKALATTAAGSSEEERASVKMFAEEALSDE